MKVFETLSQAARQWPDRVALIDAARSLTYQSLWRDIEALRIQLQELNVQPGQGIGIRARNGHAFVVGALAALGCGAVVMPIHHQMKPGELDDMLSRAPLCAILDDRSAAAVDGESSRDLKLLDGAALRFTQMRGPRVPLAPEIPDAAFVRFTSGTTGAAKGVALTHSAVLERTAAANSGLGLTCEDTVLWVLPMAYHFYVSILLYLQVGATIVVSQDYLSGSILDAAWRHQATFLYVTPMHVRLMTNDTSGRGLPPSLKCVMSVSSRLHPQSARDFLAKYRVPVAQGYGIIEVGLPIMNIQEAADHPEAIGRPVQGFEARILDDEWRPVADGKSGHLTLRGPGMFAGYLSPPRAREEVLRNGWFVTGDLAHLDEGGRIVLDGRTSSVIHVAGHKVFPEEVAGVLDQHPAVLRSRVTTRPHPQFGEVVHAEVQLRGGVPAATVDDLLTFCRRRLSSHKVPSSIDLVTELELTASGKVRHG